MKGSSLRVVWCIQRCGLVLALACGACTNVDGVPAEPILSGPRFAEERDAATLQERVILIGDAGAPREGGEPALRALAERSGAIPERATVIFLGDNIYETGMPEESAIDDTVVDDILDAALLALYESRQEAERRMAVQLAAATRSGARAWVVPGNHDWNFVGSDGLERIRALDDFVDAFAEHANATAGVRPSDGCPGPAVVRVGSELELVMFDSQWWFDSNESGIEIFGPDHPSDCGYESPGEIVEGIIDAGVAAHAAGREVIIAAHHPIRSGGPHGGYAPLLVHLFPLRMLAGYVPQALHWLPLPGAGSLAVGVRRWRSPSEQDLSHPGYERLSREIERAASEIERRTGRSPLLFAGGHDHSLQVFAGVGGPRYSVVSGLGSSDKASPVGRRPGMIFGDTGSDRPGFIEVDVFEDGAIRLSVVQWSEPHARAIITFSRMLSRD